MCRDLCQVRGDVRWISTRPLVPRGLLDQRNGAPRGLLDQRNGAPRWLLDQRLWGSAGRVVPGEERAGHVSRPRPGLRGRSPDLDTAARPSRPTRSAEWGPSRPTRSAEWGPSRPTRSAVVGFRWSSSARRGTSRARVETSTKSPETRGRFRPPRRPGQSWGTWPSRTQARNSFRSPVSPSRPPLPTCSGGRTACSLTPRKRSSQPPGTVMTW